MQYNHKKDLAYGDMCLHRSKYNLPLVVSSSNITSISSQWQAVMQLCLSNDYPPTIQLFTQDRYDIGPLFKLNYLPVQCK